MLTEDQIQLWKFLCTYQTVVMGEEAVQSTNGIPQGSTLAPGLWNVYCNGIIKVLAQLRPKKIKPAAVADDTLTISTSWWLARESIRVYEKWCA